MAHILLDSMCPGGASVGQFERVVRSREDGGLYAVLSVGGYLGAGVKKVATPVSGLGVKVAALAASEDDIKARETYDETRYVPVSAGE